MTDYNSNTGTYNPFCSGGHSFMWAGDPNYKIPEGTLCACGQTKVHYVTCKFCGHIEITMIPLGEVND